MTRKSWSSADTAVVDRAVETGLLPDGRVATQERLALVLGFNRETICNRLDGRKLPLSTTRMREGGLTSAYRRRASRARMIEACREARR